MSSPYIKLKINLDKLSKIKISNKDEKFESNRIFIAKNFKIFSKIFEDFQIILIGNPIIDNLENFLEKVDLCKNNIEKLKKDLSKINGQFIIILNFFKKKKIHNY